MSPAAVLARFDTEVLLTEKGRAAWEKIFSYDFGTVRTKLLAKGLVTEDKVDDAISEFRKFLALRLLGYHGLSMDSREVDQVWHMFILFTRDYVIFCNEVYGRYLHHQPATDAAPIPGVASERFQTAYREVFGDLHPIWTVRNDETCQERECSGDCKAHYCQGS